MARPIDPFLTTIKDLAASTKADSVTARLSLKGLKKAAGATPTKVQAKEIEKATKLVDRSARAADAAKAKLVAYRAKKEAAKVKAAAKSAPKAPKVKTTV